MATYVRICVFGAENFVHLRAILADFPDTNHQELPGAYRNQHDLYPPNLYYLMRSSFVLHLPNEILAVIINELALDNKDNAGNDNDNDRNKILAALASCRLASHVLCSLATPLFFHPYR